MVVVSVLGQRPVEELLAGDMQMELCHFTTPQKMPGGELYRPAKFGGVRTKLAQDVLADALIAAPREGGAAEWLPGAGTARPAL